MRWAWGPVSEEALAESHAVGPGFRAPRLILNPDPPHRSRWASGPVSAETLAENLARMADRYWVAEVISLLRRARELGGLGQLAKT